MRELALIASPNLPTQPFPIYIRKPVFFKAGDPLIIIMCERKVSTWMET